ncbi:hypothetical protein QFZ65_001917 [Arthrobacter sp. B3I9]|uniref:hypothetical protein n=1 Tax=Arthrobacter sp. B3I9 TaxID=3042270 RepID=UPI002793B866|nr:hypothetical protein [Arthrobacter sp. B3I9]MDQ0849979.1 hypothetical protein [Arthrobacter sp. B3I9]
MMQLFMAAALFLLAGARVPALLRNRADMVFLAAAFEALGALLMNPDIYVMVDMVLGGMNLTKLILNSLMILGLWYLHRAVMEAIAPGADKRPALVRSLPLTITLGVQSVFFLLTGPTDTTTTWAIYQGRLPALLFSLMLTGFICWVCARIAVACVRYVPRMRRSFRVGFSMVGLGSVIAFIAMAKMTIAMLTVGLPALSVINPPEFPYSLLEMAAIVLVGLGLTIPVIAGRTARRKQLRWNIETLAQVEPIWAKALRGASLDRTLKADPQAPEQDRLHRMIVEIWDAELAAGPSATFLTPEERRYLLSVEAKLHLSPATA